MNDDDAIAQLRIELRRGAADDASFDRLYTAPIRARSAEFWTPVAVAFRAAQLLASQNVASVLDIGSGVGKFCLAAACACPDIEFTGIEQRPHLVNAARAAKARLGVTNAHFFAGDATATPWIDFDGLYLYNPFEENLYLDDNPLDHTVELSRRRLVADVRRVIAALVAAPVGTCMVTYNGFGGEVPATYDLAHIEGAGTNWLRVWVKRRPTVEEGPYYRAHVDGVTLVRASGLRETGKLSGA